MRDFGDRAEYIPDEKPKNDKPKRGDRDFGMPRSDYPPLFTDALVGLLGVTHSDLDRNQAGEITERQREKLGQELKGEANAMWLILSVLLGVTLLLAVIFTFQGLSMGPLLVGAALLIVPLMALSYYRQRSVTSDREEETVGQIEGPLTLVGYGPGDYWNISVGRQKFRVSRRTFDGLSNYAPAYVRAYYSDKSKVLLSAEVLPMPDDMAYKLKNAPLDDAALEDGGDDDRLIMGDANTPDAQNENRRKNHPLD